MVITSKIVSSTGLSLAYLSYQIKKPRLAFNYDLKCLVHAEVLSVNDANFSYSFLIISLIHLIIIFFIFLMFLR